MGISSQFRIDVALFLRETSRLGPTVVGAYVNIMLDYFEQGEAPPDDDSVLARIVGCDPSLWADIRPKLEHLFVVKERWFHDYTEGQIAAAKKRIIKSVKASEKAAEKLTGSVRLDTVKDHSGTTMVGADPEAHTRAIERKQLAEKFIESQIVDDVDEDEEIEEAEPPMPPPVGIAFESQLPKDFKPSAAEIVERMNEGYKSETIADVLDQFRRYHHNAGTTSNNWPEVERRWWARKKPPLHPAEKPQPKPRVEVSRRRAPAPPTPEA